MKFFKKRETLVQSISYMAVMSAINVVFVLLTTLQPWLMFLIVFVLPLTSAIVTLYCKKRYFPIYALVTIGLCLLVTMWNISDTLFYIIPSLISGFLFGLFINYKFPSSLSIFICSIVQFGFSYLMIPFIKFLLGIDIINTFTSAFKVQNLTYIRYIVPCFIYFLSITQTSFAYIVIKDELPKFNYDPSSFNKKYDIINTICLFFFLLLSLIFSLIKDKNVESAAFGPISYLFMLMALYFTVYSLTVLLIKNNKTIYILLGVSFLIFIILFGVFYQLAKPPYGLLLIQILFLFIGIIALLNNLFIFNKNKDKMLNKEE